MVPESPIAIPERELEFTRDAEKLISDYALDLTGGKLKLVELIEKLGHLVTDSDEFKRYQGIYILSEVLNQLPSKLLNNNETNKLVDFYCDRLKDHFMILPVVLKGLNALLVMVNIDADVPLKVLGLLSDNIVCQSLSQSHRNTYYSLFKSTLRHHNEGVSGKSLEFLRYLVTAMDGESDPRNLMLLFRLVPNALRQFPPPEPIIEEMFSVLECYFPVDFSPTSKFAITREDLKEGLEDCLTATALFFPYCLPLILEKLDSKLKAAHIDSLKLLMRQCRKWGGDNLKDQLTTLWNSVKELIFGGGDSEVSNLAIQAISIAVSSSANSPDMKPHLQDCLEAVSSTKALLMDASLSLFPQAMRLQGALALSSPVPAEHIILNLLPHLLNLLDFEKQYKDVILSSLLPIFTASINFDLWKFGNTEVQSLLSKIPEVLFKYVEAEKLRPYCAKSFQILLPNLSLEQRIQLYSILKSLKSGDKNTSEKEADLIKEIAKLYPQEIISELLERLPSGDTVEVHSRNVDILSWSCHVASVTQYCCDQIVSLLENNKFTDVTVERLRSSCESIENAEVLRSMGGKECRIIDKILSVYCKDNFSFDDKIKFNLNLAKIFQCVVSSMDSSDQSELINKCIQSYFHHFCQNDRNISLLSSQIILLEGILAALQCDVIIPELEALLQTVIFISLNSDDDLARLSSARLVASIFNKQQNDKLLNDTTTNLIKEIDSNKSNTTGVRAVYLASWICKALVLSNHPSHSIWIDQLIALLSCKELCMEVAEGFKIILTDCEEYLNRQCHAKIGILYKQRVFENISKLIDLQENISSECSNAVNLTIAYFLKFSPPQLVINRLKELIKIIVRCLENEDISVSLSTLEVIASLLATKNVIFEDYTSALIPRCLKLSKSGSMDVRIAALECLNLYSSFKEIIILPYQSQVVNGLAKCLDDKKRLVRKKAVLARMKWFFLGSL